MAQTNRKMAFRVTQKEVTRKTHSSLLSVNLKRTKVCINLACCLLEFFTLLFLTKRRNASSLQQPQLHKLCQPCVSAFSCVHLPKRGSLLGALLFLGAPSQEKWQKRLISRDSYLQLRGVKVHSGRSLRHSRALQCVALALGFGFNCSVLF